MPRPLQTKMENGISEISYYGPIFINKNCIELPVSIAGKSYLFRHAIIRQELNISQFRISLKLSKLFDKNGINAINSV